MKTIVLDPGHGGTDPGAVNGARLEKNDNLRLALAVRDRLTAAGQNVIMTRSTDTYVPLSQRSAVSNNANADLFVSLHRNASVSPAAYGAAAFVQTGAPPTTVTHAENLLDSLVEAGVSRDLGVMSGNFAVLRNTRAPAVLLEVGFLSNDGDNALFDANFDDYADAVTRGILQTLGESLTPPAPPPNAGGNAVIRGIQQTLNTRYGTGLGVDGLYGPRTKTALTRGLQAELNREWGAKLGVDGIFGPRTKAAVPILRNGSRNDLVYLLQAALYTKGYTNVIPDGIFGAKTEAAVRAFQGSNHLTADGLAGPATFQSLFS